MKGASALTTPVTETTTKPRGQQAAEAAYKGAQALDATVRELRSNGFSWRKIEHIVGAGFPAPYAPSHESLRTWYGTT